MRLLALALVALALAAVPAGATAGDDWATASVRGSVLRLRLHYRMVCGKPGPGPAVVLMPRAFRLSPALTAIVDGVRRPVSVHGHAATIRLPKPPAVTCMSIAWGVLALELRGVRTPPGGTFVVHARLPQRMFAARLTIRA